MRKQVLVKVLAVVGLACVLGVGWALDLRRGQQPPLEIPLYEGAQIEFEVRLSPYEMPQGLAEFAQALSVLKVAGYQLTEEVLSTPLPDFYEQAFKEWRQVIWHRSKGLGDLFFRLFAKDHTYVLISAASRYEGADLLIAIAQADETPAEVPIVEGAELQWEVVLTSQDLLEYLKRWFTDLVRNPPSPTSLSWESLPCSQWWISWLSWLGGDMAFRLLEDLSELRAVAYWVEGDKALDILSFYEQHFSEWQRTFWFKPERSGSVRVFTRGSAEGLQELVVLGTDWENGNTEVLVLRARR